MLNFGLLNLPISGSIFGDNSTLFSSKKSIANYHINVELHIDGYNRLATTEQQSTAVNRESSRLRQPQHTQSRLRETALDTDSPQPTADKGLAAPCVLDTTLVFSDTNIKKFERLDICRIPLFVLLKGFKTVKINSQPQFTIIREGRSARLVTEEPWRARETPVRFGALPQFPNGMHTKVPKRRMTSQLWWGLDRSVTLYRSPPDECVTLAGQKFVFSRSVFDNLYLAIIRKTQNDRAFIRAGAMFLLPR